jgi:pimeloyl-ACP methyl ester carboxylesterase
MQKIAKYSLLTLLVGAVSGCAGIGGGANKVISVKEIGSIHIGGRSATLAGLPTKEVRFTPTQPPATIDPNGEFEVEQMYAQYTLVADQSKRSQYPIIMIHGGGLSGVTWETKPDGKPGWQMFFLRHGYDVYVADAVERGRASWARYPEIFKSEPVFRTKKEAWELFRFGSSYAVGAQRVAYPELQFPVGHFDQFMKQGVPRWVTNDAPTQTAYNALVEKVCPCVLMPHSQGSTFAYNAALKYPNLVKGVVGIEPSGALDPSKTDLAPLKNVPMLFVWGDKIRETPRWQGIVAPLKKMISALKQQGGVADEIDLPRAGILGNSHMIMMDRNSDEIAKLVDDWMVAMGLATR